MSWTPGTAGTLARTWTSGPPRRPATAAGRSRRCSRTGSSKAPKGRAGSEADAPGEGDAVLSKTRRQWNVDDTDDRGLRGSDKYRSGLLSDRRQSAVIRVIRV